MALPILTALPFLSTLIDKAIDLFDGDDKEQAKLLKEQINNNHLQVMAQAEINKNEAMHASIFVAGWRPFIGWICGFALAFTFIVKPFIFPFLYGYFPVLSTLPSVNDGLFELILGMLGLGGLRTFEKNRGLTR